jgi:hypothetical protein
LGMQIGETSVFSQMTQSEIRWHKEQ